MSIAKREDKSGNDECDDLESTVSSFGTKSELSSEEKDNEQENSVDESQVETPSFLIPLEDPISSVDNKRLDQILFSEEERIIIHNRTKSANSSTMQSVSNGADSHISDLSDFLEDYISSPDSNIETKKTTTRMKEVVLRNAFPRVKSKKRVNFKNYIKTTKYNIFTFFPLVMLNELRKVATLYVVVVMIFCMVPGISPVSPVSSIVPSIYVFGLALLKTAFEEYRRWNVDRKANGNRFFVYQKGYFRNVKMAHFNVGDVVRIREGEEIPAGVIVISSSKKDGSLYVTTANLDGETNLKRRESVTHSKDVIIEQYDSANENLEFHPNFSVFVEHSKRREQKNETIAPKFRGEVRIKSETESVDHDHIIAITEENFLARGYFLKNTKEIMAIVCFVGKDTRMSQNLRMKSFKFSSFDRKMNWIVIGLVLFQQFLCICFVFGSYFFLKGYMQEHWYLRSFVRIGITSDGSIFIYGLRSYMTFFIYTSWIVPMSLIVTNEVVKTIQSKRMENNIRHNGVKMVCKTSSLNQDLANIDVICSDKTGTITQNLMTFIGCYVGGKYYENKIDISKELIRIREEEDVVIENVVIQEEERREDDDDVELFLKCLLINNSIYPKIVAPEMEIQENNSDEHIKHDEEECEENKKVPVLQKRKELPFEGENTDEIAIMSWLYEYCHCKIINRAHSDIEIQIGSNVSHEEEENDQMMMMMSKKYRILKTIDFTSERRRMSVIVEDIESHDIYVFSKGSDDEMFRRIPPNFDITRFENAVSTFSRLGLRILVVSFKKVDNPNHFREFFNRQYLTNLNNESLISRYNDFIESGLRVLGVTAIEDRLDENVPETIDYLKRAGLKFYVLTGDKVETALSVCYTARVLPKKEDSVEILLTGASYHHDVNLLDVFMKRLMTHFVQKKYRKDYLYHLILDNRSLDDLLANHRSNLVRLLKKYINGAVIVCRVNPSQKAEIVDIIKKRLKKSCLAIGDGANDVLMIQKATIGIGLLGREGTQAARSSDYALPSFCKLIDLVCIEGRYNYLRNSDLVLICFYKSFMVAITILLYLWFNGFSGTVQVESYVLSVYNTLFHSAPPYVIGVYEKGLSDFIQLYTIHSKKVVITSRILEFFTFSSWEC